VDDNAPHLARTVTAQAATAEDLAVVRQYVVDICRTAGLDPHRSAQFSVATNEITTNAIEHGGGSADIVIMVDDAQINIEVQDRGPGIAGTATDRPEPAAVSGRGLWLADQLCDGMRISSTSQGTTVRLTMNR
jgi:anti-sigma regulatory factor (Ser/Thr protein kinase)